MGSAANRRTRRSAAYGAAAIAVVLPLSTAVAAPALAQPAPALSAPAPAQSTPPRLQAPAGVTVQRVEYLTDRRVAIWVYSPAMGEAIQVQLLLARDWNRDPGASFPSVVMLDGLRARDDENGWTIETDAEAFYADKNVNVVLPVGGQSSFYSDWLAPDNGKNYQWETFLTQELPPILQNDWRSTDKRGVVGLSMGGTSAMFLAARNPGMFQFAASLSGILSTTSLGMPQAVQFAMRDAGNFDSAKMWGAPNNPLWAQHDPYQLTDKLEGVSLYVSSGSGSTGPYDQPSAIPGVSTNYAGTGLEILSRLSSQAFATKLNKEGIPAQVVYRPSGTHSWPYWQFEMHQLWPQLAHTLGVDVDKPNCDSAGGIASTVAANGWLGDCLTPEYEVPGGRAQDFRHGRVFSGPDGAYAVGGRIAGNYQQSGGPGGPLGLPTTNELGTPDGRGRFNHFQNGSIYWTPQTGAHAVRGAIRDEWARQGWEGGPLGYPTADEVATPEKPGAVQGFEIGAMYYSPTAGTHAVLGKIMEKYGQMGYENGWLGFATTNEIPVKDNGRFTAFEGGNIYWSPATGAWPVRLGPIFDAWKDEGYENGRLGFPTSDEFDIPGGVQQNYQGGFVTVVDGKATVH